MSENEEGTNYVGQIPVRNIWLFMLYASDLYRDFDQANIDVEENPDHIPDLVAEILCHRVDERIARNLSYGYLSQEAVLNRVRGRIDFLTTERRRLLDRGRIACRFDELTVDTVRNRFVRSALECIAGIVKKRTLAQRCRSLATELRRMGVLGERPTYNEVSIERFGLHDIGDRPMVAAAQLAFDLTLPTESLGKTHLSLPERDLSWFRKLYEKGIAGFYDVKLKGLGWKVTAGNRISWQVERKSSRINEILPNMQTDITLEHPISNNRIVIDTKFNAMLKSGWHREETIRSGYLYQMYAYLRSQEGRNKPVSDNATGLFLHPSIGSMYYEYVTIQNHEIRFATVDLASSSDDIRDQLLLVVIDSSKTYDVNNLFAN